MENVKYSLGELACELRDAKAAEDRCKSQRICLEEQIAALIPQDGDKKSKTVTLEDGTKIRVERGFNYRADFDQLQIAAEANGMYAPVKTKTTREVDESGYEWYRKNDPVAFSMLSQYVTATPKKVAVTIQEKK